MAEVLGPEVVTRTIRSFAGREAEHNKKGLVSHPGGYITYDREETVELTAQGNDVALFLNNGEWSFDKRVECREYIRQKLGINLILKKSYKASTKNAEKTGKTHYASAACFYHVGDRGSCPVTYRIDLFHKKESLVVQISPHKDILAKHSHLEDMIGPVPSSAAYAEALRSSKFFHLFTSRSNISPFFEAGLLNLEFAELHLTPRVVSRKRQRRAINDFMELFNVDLRHKTNDFGIVMDIDDG